ncbi:Ankyrin repeat and BTB/POZ domain-containing protein 2, partial [Balamuthia mandrillaris]
MQQGSTRRVTFDPFPFVESMLDCLEKTCQDKSEEEGKPASSSSLDNSLKALSDVTFVVQGQPLRAHKSILTAVSPYFERIMSLFLTLMMPMFLPTAGLLEAQSNRVVVDDTSPAIFKQLLAFIYSGANPDIIDEKKQEATNAQAVLELLPLAHRYNLSALRCQYCLCKEVDESNACLLYDIAEYHDCPLLSEFCMAYLRTHFVTMAERGFLEYASEELLKRLATNVQKDVKYQHIPFPPTEVPLNHSTSYRTLIELLSDGLTEYAATLARAKKRQESARIEAEKEKETEEEEESEQEEKGRECLTSSASSAAEDPHNALKLWRDLSTITLVSLVDLSASDSRVVHSLRCQNLLNKFFPLRGIVCNPSAAEVTELPSPETLQDGHIYMVKTQRYAAPTLCSEIATAMKLPLPAILKEVFMFKFHDNGTKRGKRGAYDLILLLTLGSRKVDEKALKRYFKSLEGERPFIK